jgi:hypothetical protein
MDTKDDKETNGSLLMFAHTWQQAIEDGVLIDVTEAAKDLGFCCRVAFSRTAWDRHIREFPGISDCAQDVRVEEVLSAVGEGIRWYHDEGWVPCLFYIHGWSKYRPNMPLELKFEVMLACDEDGMGCITITLPEDTPSDC